MRRFAAARRLKPPYRPAAHVGRGKPKRSRLHAGSRPYGGHRLMWSRRMSAWDKARAEVIGLLNK
jgi:hypothetical protein